MEKIENTENVELRSEDYHYILGKTPPWILRWGSIVILFIFLTILASTYFFKYPDTISSTFILTGTTPPARIKARVSGLLVKLYVVDNQDVQKDDYLAIIENTANDNDVRYIKSFLSDLFKEDSINYTLPQKDLQLGDLQSSYLSFYQTVHNYIEFRKNNFHDKKMRILKERIAQNTNKYNQLLQQQNIFKEQYRLKQNQFERDSMLNKKEIISQLELENTSLNYLDTQVDFFNLTVNIQNIKISMTEMVESLIETENDFIEKENHYKIEMKNYALQLQSEIDLWEINYVLKSPIDGTISFNNYWSENQNIIAGEEVFNVVPSNSGKPIAKAFLPIARSGKVKKGQKVNLHFDNFPDNEYGVLRGVVRNISLLPSVSENNHFYIVEIALPNGLTTSYKKQLPYYLEMKGSAEIITDDLSLLQRILFPIKKILIERLNPD